jgi:hypothetical protein
MRGIGVVFRYLLGFRVNIALAFLGAFAVMALIKLTAYLPGKYYFNFSKLYAGASEPFIVDPPSVTGAKLCALMAQHNLSGGDIGRHVDCRASFKDAEAKSRFGAALFDKDQIDRIYTTALTSDAALRAHLARSGPMLRPPPIADAELTEILRTSGSVSEAYRAIWQKYEPAFSGQVDAVMKTAAAQAFAGIRTRDGGGPTDVSDDASGPKLKGLKPDEVAAIRKAHAAFLATLAAGNLGAAAKPITKSSVDAVIETAYAAESIPNGVASYYATTIKDHAKDVLRAKFAEAGVTPIDQDTAKKIIFAELVRDGLHNYVTATLVRLAPVLLVGLLLGLFFGRGELFSVSFAGALAAFLLTWPIMLMWDRIVQSTWHDKKLIFMAFYAVYIISFFLTARVGALIGTRLREGAPERLTSMIDRETGAMALKGASWTELAGNIVMGLLANGAVAAWNVIIPLNAS